MVDQTIADKILDVVEDYIFQYEDTRDEDDFGLFQILEDYSCGEVNEGETIDLLREFGDEQHRKIKYIESAIQHNNHGVQLHKMGRAGGLIFAGFSVLIGAYMATPLALMMAAMGDLMSINTETRGYHLKSKIPHRITNLLELCDKRDQDLEYALRKVRPRLERALDPAYS